LKLTYTHVQIALYRPFLHQIVQRPAVDQSDETYFYGVACIESAMQAIETLEELNDSGLNDGPYWFLVYTTFFAVTCLLVVILRDIGDLTKMSSLESAECGRKILLKLAPRSLIAEKCADFLMVKVRRSVGLLVLT
jgi:hypothetical protein